MMEAPSRPGTALAVADHRRDRGTICPGGRIFGSNDAAAWRNFAELISQNGLLNTYQTQGNSTILLSGLLGGGGPGTSRAKRHGLGGRHLHQHIQDPSDPRRRPGHLSSLRIWRNAAVDARPCLLPRCLP